MNDDLENNQPNNQYPAPNQPEPESPSPFRFEDDTTVRPPAQQPTPVFDQSEPLSKRPRHGLKVGAIVSAIVVIVVLVGFGVFYFLIRIPDSQYDAAIRNLESMKSAAQTIHDGGGVEDLNADVISKHEDFEPNANVYVANLEKLRSNKVLEADVYVRAAYDEQAPAIEPYGQATLDLVETSTGFLEVKTECEAAVKEIYAGSSEAQFEARIAGCEKLLDQYKSFPAESFADWYQTYRTKLLALIDTTYRYFMIQSYGTETQKATAAQDVQDASLAFGSAMSAPATIANTTDPTGPSDEITELIDTLVQRRDVFFRR